MSKPLEFDQDYMYRNMDVVSETKDGVSFIYRSLYGDDPINPNRGNRPFESPSAWALLEQEKSLSI